MIQSKALKSVALVSVTAAATTLLIQACGGGAVAQSAATVDPVVGVWDTTVTVKDCTSAAVLASFKGLSVLNHGGTMTADNSQPPTTRGAAFGTWRHESGNNYASNMVFMRFNPDGTLAGTQKVARTFTVSADGNSFSGNIARQVLDTAGTVIQQGCAAESGTRVTS